MKKHKVIDHLLMLVFNTSDFDRLSLMINKLSHLAQSGTKIKGRYFISWWYLTSSSNLLLSKLFKSGKLMWDFFFSHNLSFCESSLGSVLLFCLISC